VHMQSWLSAAGISGSARYRQEQMSRPKGPRFCFSCRGYVNEGHVCGRSETSAAAVLPVMGPVVLPSPCDGCNREELCVLCDRCLRSLCLQGCWPAHEHKNPLVIWKGLDLPETERYTYV